MNEHDAYKQKKRLTKKEVANAKKSSWEEWYRSLSEPKKKVDLFRIAKQMQKERQDVIGGKYIKNSKGEIQVKEREIMERWKEYFRELLNEQSDYQLDEVAKVEGPLKEITEKEVEAALKGMKKGEVVGPTGVTSDLLQAAGMIGL